ncbi:uncharacterized protein LOC125801351 isoform X2 [Astyanax mexicanus]|nr:uncharacterized protein LOC125801351 isoform X2 [Astyanax mexicanus]
MSSCCPLLLPSCIITIISTTITSNSTITLTSIFITTTTLSSIIIFISTILLTSSIFIFITTTITPTSTIFISTNTTLTSTIFIINTISWQTNQLHQSTKLYCRRSKETAEETSPQEGSWPGQSVPQKVNQETATSFFQVLATIYRDEREYSRKIYDVGNTEHLIETASAEQLGYVVVRILKFNPQFQEFIDADRNVDIRNLDRFQLFLSCKETESSQPMATSVSQAQHTQVSQEHEKPRSILEKKAPETLDELKTKGTVTEKARIKLVKLCVSDLVEKHGFTEKVALAKNIIAVFPESPGGWKRGRI